MYISVYITGSQFMNIKFTSLKIQGVLPFESIDTLTFHILPQVEALGFCCLKQKLFHHQASAPYFLSKANVVIFGKPDKTH